LNRPAQLPCCLQMAAAASWEWASWRGLHEVLQELPPCEGVQAGDRLVEQEKLGPLGDRQGEGELGPLAAGQRPGPLPELKAELVDTARGELAVPAMVEPGAHAQVPGDGKPAVDRRVLGDEADPGELGRGAGGALAQDPDLSRGRVEQPGRQVQQGGLARAVGSDQPGHPPGGDRQGAVGERPPPPVALAEAAGLDGGVHATPSVKQVRTEVR
jgi:hypothetical protein